VLGGGATEQGYTRIREEGQELLRLTQVSRRRRSRRRRRRR